MKNYIFFGVLILLLVVFLVYWFVVKKDTATNTNTSTSSNATGTISTNTNAGTVTTAEHNAVIQDAQTNSLTPLYINTGGGHVAQ